MNKVLIKNAQIVNEGIIVKGDVFIENDLISSAAIYVSSTASLDSQDGINDVALAAATMSIIKQWLSRYF